MIILKVEKVLSAGQDIPNSFSKIRNKMEADSL
jgi:hypothetical protein